MKKISFILSLFITIAFSADTIIYQGEKIQTVGDYPSGRIIKSALNDGNGSSITSTNGALTTQSDATDIARGKVSGSLGFGAFGEITTAGAVTKNIIWPDGVFNIPNQTTGEAITFVSSSAQDASGGTGIHTLEVHYLDVNLTSQEILIDLNGTTPVTGQLSGVRFIQCMHVTVAGSTSSAVGQINAYQAGSPATIYSLISAGAERCSSSMRMVPAGKRLIVLGAVTSSISVTADTYSLVRLVATELDTHQYISPFIFIPFGSIGTQNNGIAYTFPVPQIFNAGTIVGGRVTTNKAAIVSLDWFGFLEDI